MIKNDQTRVIVNINDLRHKNPERVLNLLNNAVEEIIAFQRALKEYITNIDVEYSKKQQDFFFFF